jgi:UDP-N-acetylglucosamine 1-carboxyvinyltransferase
VLSLVSEGESTIEDHVFPERFDHMDELKKIGARYTKSAHGVTIQGGVQLLGGEMYAANLRSAAALVLGALSARSPSKVVRISVLNRGYPGFFLKINNILSD